MAVASAEDAASLHGAGKHVDVLFLQEVFLQKVRFYPRHSCSFHKLCCSCARPQHSQRKDTILMQEHSPGMCLLSLLCLCPCRSLAGVAALVNAALLLHWLMVCKR
jgi:hypothetical protein